MVRKLWVVLVVLIALGCTSIVSPVVRVESHVYNKLEEGSQLVLGAGTGFFVSEDGVIMTASHVIEGYNRVLIYHTGRKVARPATVLLNDRAADIAILSVQGVHVEKPFKFCADLSPGDDLAAWAWRGYGTEHTRGPLLGAVHGGVWAAGLLAGPGFSGGPVYLEERDCVAGILTRSNLNSKEPLIMLVRPELSSAALKLLKSIAPASVKGL